jgi:dethiobiotin synthetase
MLPGLFISATGTASGKTFITRALAGALRRSGRRPAALKPVETGVQPDPLDAIALAGACGLPHLAGVPGLYRASLPLAPYAAAIETRTPPPDIAALVTRIHELAISVRADCLLVEGAGGLLVPLDATRTLADLAAELALPLLIVARDELGVLSSALTCIESARARRLRIAAVILNACEPHPTDPSPRTNARILRERLDVPVLTFPRSIDDDDALADAAERLGLPGLLI